MSREVDVFIHFLFLAGAILCWLSNRRKLNLRYIDYCGLFLMVTFIVDGIAAFIMLTSALDSNLFLYHILTPIQTSLILMIYYHVINNQIYKRMALWLIPASVIVSLSISFTIQPFNDNNTYSILIKHVIVIISTLTYFFELISTTPYSKIYLQPIFWISVGLLFHSSLNVLMEGFSNYLGTYSEPKYSVVYILYSLSNYCLFLLIGTGLIMPNIKSVIHESEFHSK